ncbi:malonate--CoA ligase isoform X2 [Physcomitrium patens]|uniref:malonate--CoA ligase isoform X2 n=1 Tax=Physcomitrium patens TaxID=3218 RepID=UPI003CCE029F
MPGPRRSSVITSAHINEGMEVLKLEKKLDSSQSQNAIAISAGQKNYSYGHLLQSAFQISKMMHHGEGVKSTKSNGTVVGSEDLIRLRGTRVGIMAKPSAEFVASMWAVWLNGAVAVPLALSYPEAELVYILTDADVSAVASTEEFRDQLEGVAKKCSADYLVLPEVSCVGDTSQQENLTFEDMLAEIDKASSELEGANPALIIYTSGTTGKPKGVVHTHASIGAQVRMLAEAWEYTNSDRFLHCLPLHHVHGVFNALLAPLFVGASVEFLPKFSVSGIWNRWKDSYPREGVRGHLSTTVFTGVPTMYTRLLQGYDAMDADSQKACSYAARQLRLMMCGSSALPEPIMEKWERVTGHRLLERYGMTEFVMALSNPLNGERRAGFVGMPLPGVQMLIAEEGREEADVGELCIKSPAMFQEYWRKPKVTSESFREDGYFRTGDTVTVVDGYVKILGRTSVDIVKSGGYKLSALEIEAVLLQHPAISECAVIGVPDKTYGEVMTAIVVIHENVAAEASAKSEPALTLDAFTPWARERMAPYKIPSQLLVWDALPLNAMGKVNKKELKATLLKNAAN